MKILIDPGHGGDYSGAVVGSIREADLNLEFSLSIAQALIESGHIVSLTRFSDATVSLANRVAMEKRLRPDLFLSIHCNAFSSPSAHGMEVFTSKGDTQSDCYAQAIIESLADEFTGRRMRTDTSDGDDDKEKNFYVLRKTSGPAVLIEVEFMTSPEAMEFLSQSSTPIRLGRSISKAFISD